MKLIIDIKPSATVARIEELSEALALMKVADSEEAVSIHGFSDVIESITAEKK